MDEQEKDILFLMTLTVSGAVLASGMAAFQQWLIVLPLTLAVFLIMILSFYVYKHRFANLAESIEKLVMIMVLITIIISFICLYRPV